MFYSCFLYYSICVQTVILAITLFMGFVYWFLFVKNSPYATKHRYDEESYFIDEHGQQVKFPNLSDDPIVDLSVVVPAYNEEYRLRPMLDSCLQWLTSVNKSSFEVIVVSDGSTDNTCDVVMEYVQKYGADRVRLLKLIKNRGKGGAVCLGMLSARGRKLLFADADGATKFDDIEKLESLLKLLLKTNKKSKKEKKAVNQDDLDNMNDICAVVCGSRAHLENEAIAKRSSFRTLLMIAFQVHVWTFGVRSIKDTQCGFKLFTRPAAKILFNSLHVDGWAFDVEMLYIAEKLNMSLSEVAVNWTEIEGSKIVPVWSWLQMGFDVLAIFLRYRTGSWKIRYKKND